MDLDCFDDTQEYFWDLDDRTDTQVITDPRSGEFLVLGEADTNAALTIDDDYDPMDLDQVGLLFDGIQFLRYPTPGTGGGGANFKFWNVKPNVITIEGWFRTNPDNPQGDNTGWLYAEMEYMEHANSTKMVPAGPVHIGLGVRGEAAVAVLNDRRVEVVDTFTQFDTSTEWRFIQVTFLRYAK